MKLKTEINVSLRQSQDPVRYSIFTAILVFLPEILFFIGGNVALYNESIANFLEAYVIEHTEEDGGLLDDEYDWLEATGSEATSTDEGTATFGLGDNVYFFGGDTVSFWGDVYNNDSNQIRENGVVIFYGEKWVNSSKADLKSDGLLCLTSPRPYPYAASFSQEIDNGGRTAYFPDVVIDNPNNVYMMNDLIVEDTLFFMNGKLVLDGHNLTMLNDHPDAIQGYNENRYIVTGEDKVGGYVTRTIGKDEIDFPIGTDTSSYTPIRISNKGTTDDYSVRVFAGVYEKGNTGTDQSAQSVGVTWEIQEKVDGGSNLTLEMQHNAADEGSDFNPGRHFVSRYTGVWQNTEGDTVSGTEWDLMSYASSGSGSSSGYITTGSAINSAVVSTRSGITKTGFFAKASYSSGGALPVELLYFNARPEETFNSLKWSTSMEIDNYYFTIERSTDGENYEQMDRVPGAGNTTEKTDYKYEDLQPFEITYYRLRQTDYDGKEEIIGLQVVRRDQIVRKELLIYPNPCVGEFLHVELPETIEEGDYVEVVQLSGASLLKVDLDPFGMDPVLRINVSQIPRGIYLVQMSNNNMIRTKKLIIPDRR